MDSSAVEKRREEKLNELRAKAFAPDLLNEDMNSSLAVLTDLINMGGVEAQDMIDGLRGSYCAAAEQVSVSAAFLQALGVSGAEAQRIVEESACNLVIGRFDAAAAEVALRRHEEDSVPSSVSGTAAPRSFDEWLPRVIEFRRWRFMFYELLEQHPESSFLGGVVEAISKERSLATELVHAPSACDNFDVFCRYLSAGLSQLLARSSADADYEAEKVSLLRMACRGEHTYLLAQVLLYNLRSGVGCAAARSLSHDLERAAIAAGHDVTKYAVYLCGAGGGPSSAGGGLHSPHHHKASAAMLSILARRQLSAADVLILYNLYAEQPVDAPPVELLRLPLFIELLVDAVFLPPGSGAIASADQLHKYIYLYTCACVLPEKQTSSVAPTAASGSMRALREQLRAYSDSVDAAAAVCRTNRNLLHHFEQLQRLARAYQGVAFGLVRFVEHVLAAPERYELAQVDQLIVYFVLLDEVANEHETLHNRIFALLCGCLARPYANFDELAALELRKGLVDRFVHLLYCGFVDPVLERLYHCLQESVLDMSTVRYFVIQVLEMVAPPYGEAFLSRFAAFLRHEQVIAGFSKHEAKLAADFLNTATQRRRGVAIASAD